MIGFLAALAMAPLSGPVTSWTPAGVSSPMFESHPAFDPWNGDLYFVRSKPDFSGWRILTSRCEAKGWRPPVDAPFAGDGLEADPWFAPGGRTLYFISSRATDGVAKKDLDIWKVTRAKDGRWGTPERLPEPVNSSGQEWFPRLGPGGWLYFGSSRPGGLGKTDIWRAREVKGAWTVENLGPSVNTADDEYEPLPSPDGKTMIVQAGDSYYQTWPQGGGWSPRVKLGREVNVNGSEIGALFSPSGRSLMFARDTKSGLSGEFLVLKTDGEAWPKPCPAR